MIFPTRRDVWSWQTRTSGDVRLESEKRSKADIEQHRRMTPRNGNRNCDPKCRVFQHRCEIPLFGHTPAICNYRRPQLWANGAPYCQMFERERPCRPSSILLRCGAFLLGLRADHNGAISERCHPGDRQGTACSDVCGRCRAGPLGDRIAGQQSMVSWWNPNNCSPD